MLFLAALVLVIPLFLPPTVKVTTSKEITLSPAQVFYIVASYTDRNKWDPWLEADQLKVTGEAFEFYFNDPTQEPDITKSQTLIAFPLKKKIVCLWR